MGLSTRFLPSIPPIPASPPYLPPARYAEAFGIRFLWSAKARMPRVTQSPGQQQLRLPQRALPADQSPLPYILPSLPSALTHRRPDVSLLRRRTSSCPTHFITALKSPARSAIS